MSKPSHPQWWQVYALLPLMIVLLVVEANIPDSLVGHRLLEFGIVLVTFGLMAAWVYANQAALNDEQYAAEHWHVEPEPRLEIRIDPDLLPEPDEPVEEEVPNPVLDLTKGRYN